MNCEEVSELLPGYVFGALDIEETEAVEAHLRAGHEHDAELVELRATVFALDRHAGESEPSAALAGRVASIPAATPAARKLRFFPASTAWRAVAAAAVLVAVFGAGWLGASISGGDSEPEYLYVIKAESGAAVSLEGPTDAGVHVVMEGFARLPEGLAYQLWAVRDDGWVSIGVCNVNNEGGWVGDFAATLDHGELIAITVEPAGGSPAPTTQPVLQGGL